MKHFSPQRHDGSLRSPGPKPPPKRAQNHMTFPSLGNAKLGRIYDSSVYLVAHPRE